MNNLKFSYIIRRLDLFGVPITFIGAHRLYYQTKMGGYLSILVIVFLSYVIYFNLDKLSNYSTLVAVTNNNFQSNPSTINVKSNNFLFAVKIDQKNYLKEPIFMFSLKWQNMDEASQNDTITSQVDIPMMPCSMEQFKNLYFFSNEIMQSVQQNNIDEWLCPQFGNNVYDLSGKPGASQFEYLKLSIQVCNQSASSQDWNYTCPSQTQIDELIQQKVQQQGIKLDFLMSNINIIPNNENFAQGFITNELQIRFNPFWQYFEVDIFFRQWQIVTDQSIFPINKNIENTLLINDQSEINRRDLIRHYQNQTDLGCIFFRNSQYSYFTTRSVEKLTVFLAYIGGLFNALFVGVSAFMTVYCRYQLWLKLFKIHYTIILQSQQFQNIYENEKRKRLTVNSTIYKTKYHSELTKINLKNLVKEKYHPDNTLIPKIKHVFGLLFCICSKKKWIEGVGFMEAIGIIEKDLNIVQYFKLQHDVEKIKQILFNEEQLKIFELQQKQTVVLKDGHFQFADNGHFVQKIYDTAKGFKRTSVKLITKSEDKSDQLDSTKNQLYGLGFQEKILSEYICILEALNQLERQKEQEQKILSELDSKDQLIQNQLDIHQFEQSINKRIMMIFDQDIQQIIKQDQLLKDFCFKNINKNQYKQQDSIEYINEENDFDHEYNRELTILDEDSISNTKQNYEIELPVIQNQSSDIQVSQFYSDYQLQEFLIHKIGILNNIPYQKDLTRYLDTSFKQSKSQLSQTQQISLFKTLFFREERLLLLNEFILLEYACQFKSYRPNQCQTVQYLLTFSHNPTFLGPPNRQNLYFIQFNPNIVNAKNRNLY